ncbi:MAG: ion channel activity [Trizodia sp. TS-e1964]|nr:MAG: ion channel activity [Trizodia sp. TS-e1964]
MGNDALNVNPSIAAVFGGVVADISITEHGSDWLWAVTAIMTLSTLIILGMSFRVPRTARVFHYITASITLVAAIAYFTMASNLGWVPVNVEFVRSRDVVSGYTREIFYARYIDWFITTPLLLLDLLLTAGLPWPTILFTILLDEVMIVTGLIGALTSTSYKWGYFVFGCIAFLGVAWNVMFVARQHAFALGSDIHRTFISCGVLTTFLWFLYPIAWGLCEGGNVISPDSEAIFYGILDILAKPVFGFLLLAGHRNIDPAILGLAIRDVADRPTGTGVRGEKTHHGGVGTTHHGGVATGTTAGTTTGAPVTQTV